MGKIIEFNANGNSKQIECFEEWNDPEAVSIVYGGSKGSGKTFVGVSIIFGSALMYSGTHYFIARKKLNDLRKYTKPSVKEVMDLWGIDESLYWYNGTDNYYELYNGSKVYFIQARYEPSDPTYARFGSMQFTQGWIEEAGEFEQEATNALIATVGRWKNKEFRIRGKVLQTCNPAKNYLYSEYYKKHKKGELEPHKRFIQALPSDNKMLPENYIKNLELTLSKNAKQRLLFGNWEFDDDPTALCDYEDICEIFTNDQERKDEKGNVLSFKKYITADVARFGSDKAVIMVWHGWIVIEIYEFKKSSVKELQDLIQHLREKHKIPKKNCIADEDGVGGGLVDNTGIRGFVNNSSPIDNRKKSDKKKNESSPNYRSLQDQCGYFLAPKINNYELFIECEVSDAQKEHIIEELEQLKTFEADKDSKLRLLPKEKIKDAIGRSPDYRDTLLMRSFFDIEKKYSGKYVVA